MTVDNIQPKIKKQVKQKSKLTINIMQKHINIKQYISN